MDPYAQKMIDDDYAQAHAEACPYDDDHESGDDHEGDAADDAYYQAQEDDDCGDY